MAKPTAPLFSLGARGTLADAITYSGWKGIPYVRTRVIPANPQSAAQVDRRNAFAVLSAAWNRGGLQFRQGWDAAADGQAFTGRNRFMGANLAGITPGANWSASMLVSVANSGALPPPTAVGADGGGQQLNLTLGTPVLPPGWTIVARHAVAAIDGPNDDGVIWTPRYASAAGATVGILCQVAGTYWAAGYIEYTDPNGLTRYSLSTIDPSVVIA